MNTKEEYLFDLIYTNKKEEKAIDFYNLFKKNIPYDSCNMINVDYPVYLTLLANNRGYDKLLGLIIDDSLDFNYRGGEERVSLLISLIENKKWDIVEKVLIKELNINKKDKSINDSRIETFNSPLSLLIKNNKEDLAILAVKAGADYDLMNYDTGVNIEKLAMTHKMTNLVNVIDEQKQQDKIKKSLEPNTFQKAIDSILKFRIGNNSNKTNNLNNKQ